MAEKAEATIGRRLLRTSGAQCGLVAPTVSSTTTAAMSTTALTSAPTTITAAATIATTVAAIAQPTLAALGIVSVFRLGQERFAAEAELAVGAHFDQFDLDLVAHLDVVLHLLDVTVIEFRDVQEAFRAGQDLHDDAEPLNLSQARTRVV